jgi:hypothetical protein
MPTRRQAISLLATSGFAALANSWAPLARAAGVRRLVFVHGRGQAPDDALAQKCGQPPFDGPTLRAAWMDSLAAGLAGTGVTLPSGLAIEVPFYGCKLQEYVIQSQLPMSADLLAHGGSTDDDYLNFQAEIAQDLAGRAGVTDEDIQKQFGDEPTPHGIENYKSVIAIVRAIDAKAPGISTSFLEDFMRDVYLYCRIPKVRDAIDGIVRAAITPEPCVVVAHSLGTVAAYNVLRKDQRALHVPLFVTLGCPLAILAIRKSLAPLSDPEPVGSWYNAFDPQDIVALNPLDARGFPIGRPIENNNAIANITENHHGIDGYLGHKVVARRVAAAFD